MNKKYPPNLPAGVEESFIMAKKKRNNGHRKKYTGKIEQAGKNK